MPHSSTHPPVHGTDAGHIPNADGAKRPRRFGPVAGLVGATILMVLSLSAFVVGSNPGDVAGSRVGERAPNFSARAADDRRVTLLDFAGRPALLIFADAFVADEWTVFLQDPRLPENLAVLAFTKEANGTSPAERLTVLSDGGSLVAARFDADRAPRPVAVLVGPDGYVVDRGTPSEVAMRLLSTPAGASASAH